MTRTILRTAVAAAAGLLLVAGGIAPPAVAAEAMTVSLPGSFDSELGCSSDWQPSCPKARLALRADGFWSLTATLPPGSYAYKVAIDGSFDENYGAGGVADGADIPLTVTADRPDVTFFYDPVSHVVTTDAEHPIAVAVGDFQSELGCPADWSPDCLESLLTDPDGDGFATVTADLPPGRYASKIALGGTWDENYGRYGRRDGADIPVVATGGATTFAYDVTRHYADAGTGIVVAAGSFQSELGCPADWDPSCLRTWLQDPDGDGVSTLRTTALPRGRYEMKAALGTTWDVNYGRFGRPNGANIAFRVRSAGDAVTLRYVSRCHLLIATVTPRRR